MKESIFFLIHLICFIALKSLNAASKKSLKPLAPSEDDYTHSLEADEDKPDQYQLFWKIINDDEIQFEVHCKSTGWVGLGLSTNGGMAGSDIVIGWVKNGKAYLKDCYASEKAQPIEDLEQNYELIDGAEADGYTILKFKRKLITCDLLKDKDINVYLALFFFLIRNFVFIFNFYNNIRSEHSI